MSKSTKFGQKSGPPIVSIPIPEPMRPNSSQQATPIVSSQQLTIQQAGTPTNSQVETPKQIDTTKPPVDMSQFAPPSQLDDLYSLGIDVTALAAFWPDHILLYNAEGVGRVCSDMVAKGLGWFVAHALASAAAQHASHVEKEDREMLSSLQSELEAAEKIAEEKRRQYNEALQKVESKKREREGV